MEDQLVTSIIALSGSPGDLAQLQNQLKATIPSIIGHTHLAAQVQALQNLNPRHHSLGVVYFLDAQLKSGLQLGDQGFVEYTSRFLQTCSPQQVKLVPELFASVCRRYKDFVIAAGCPRIGVLPLLTALRSLQPSPEHLTPIHSDFLQLCLLSKVYNAAAQLLSEDIYDVDPARTAMTPTDLFLYSYYGGMVCIGRKEYGRALELLLQSLTAPALAGNAIVVAAYKKYVLASLIHAGAVTPLPRLTSSKTRSLVESECRPYNELATAYATHNPDKLRKCIEQQGATYTADTNMGLVKQVAQSLTKRNIQRLTQTYLTLPLADIASNVGLASADTAELYILRMIESGDIHAQINKRDGMVRFLEDPQQYNNAAVAARIDGQVRQCIALASKMQTMHDTVLCDKQYLQKVTSKERSRYEAGEDVVGGSQLFQP